MSKLAFLENLDETQLKKIAKAENLPIPRNFDKDLLIKYLQGTLTLEKSKKYEKMYTEKVVERDIHIHERIKEKTVHTKSEDETQASISREGKILKLMKVKMQKDVVSAVANKLHLSEPEGTRQEALEEMDEELLQKLYEIFIELKQDRTGRNFEYLCANYLKKMWGSNIDKLELDHEFHGIGEIDIIGFDSYMLPVCIAECKDRTAQKEDVDKWITNTKSLYDLFSQKVEEKHKGNIHMNSYFFTSERITQEVLARYKNHKVNEHGVYQKIPFISPKAHLYIYEVKEDKFDVKFPR